MPIDSESMGMRAMVSNSNARKNWTENHSHKPFPHHISFIFSQYNDYVLMK
jgi:hypothetical protein